MDIDPRPPRSAERERQILLRQNRLLTLFKVFKTIDYDAIESVYAGADEEDLAEAERVAGALMRRYRQMQNHKPF